MGTDKTGGLLAPLLRVYGDRGCPACIGCIHRIMEAGYRSEMVLIGDQISATRVLEMYPQCHWPTSINSVRTPIVVKEDGSMIGSYYDLLNYLSENPLRK